MWSSKTKENAVKFPKMKIIYAALVNQSYSSISSKAQRHDLYKYLGDYEYYDDLRIL